MPVAGPDGGAPEGELLLGCCPLGGGGSLPEPDAGLEA